VRQFPPQNAPQRAQRKCESPADRRHSFFKTLVEHEITVELKNEVQIRGTLKSVDQYLNIKLDNAEAVDELRWPHLVCARCFPDQPPVGWNCELG
jgi:small nuclear ribonucleoprotein (snRNP)-like protein